MTGKDWNGSDFRYLKTTLSRFRINSQKMSQNLKGITSFPHFFLRLLMNPLFWDFNQRNLLIIVAKYAKIFEFLKAKKLFNHILFKFCDNKQLMKHNLSVKLKTVRHLLWSALVNYRSIKIWCGTNKLKCIKP